jgi:hypothetical protein
LPTSLYKLIPKTMKNRLIAIGVVAIALLVTVPTITRADSTQTLLNAWRVVSGFIVPSNSSNGLKVPALGSAGSPCVVVSSTGAFSTSTCGGVATPGGSNGQLQYNNAGNLAGIATGTPGTYLTASSTSPSGYAWVTVSGTGSVTSVDMTVPTGLAISGNPITTSGTLALSYASGYAGVLTASTTNWNNLYNNVLSRLAVSTGTAGTTFNISTSTNALTINLPFASGSNSGQLSSTDWTTFNNKQNALTLPLAVNQGGTGSTSLNTTLVSEGTNLYFTNARAAGAISLTTSGTSGAATYNNTTGALNIPQYQAAGTYLNSYNVTSANGLITVSTSTSLATLTASTSPTFTNLYTTNASTTGFTATTICLTGDICRTTWPTGGGTGSISTSTTAQIGKVAIWTGLATLGNGSLFDNGTVAGYNATSSTISFNVQGTAGSSNTIFNVASSSGTSAFLVASTSKIGINTAIPAYPVHLTTGSGYGYVQDNGTVQFGTSVSNSTGGAMGTITTHDFGLFTGGGSNAITIKATTNNVAIGTTTAATRLSLTGTSAVDPFDISSTSGVSLLRVTQAGRLGLGTTTPGSNLLIQGSAGQTNALFSVASSSGTSVLTVQPPTTASYNLIVAGTSTAANLFVVDSVGNVFINHLIGSSTLPTIATSTGVGIGAGTSASLESGSTDVSGLMHWKTTNAPATNSTIVTVTFSRAFAAAPFCRMTPGNSTSTVDSAKYYASTTASTLSLLSSVSTAITATTTYDVYYDCTGKLGG